MYTASVSSPVADGNTGSEQLDLRPLRPVGSGTGRCAPRP